MREITFNIPQFDPIQLNDELKNAMGDQFEGITSAGPIVSVWVGDELPFEGEEQIAGVIQAHRPAVKTPEKTLEERVTELEQLVQQLLNK